MTRIGVLFAIFFTVIALGCGGGTSESPSPFPPPADPSVTATPQPVHANGDASVTATVGSAGGTLAISNGARIEIPAGALPEEHELIFSVVERTQAFNNHDYEEPIGPTLLFQPATPIAEGTTIDVSIPQPPIPTGFTAEHLTVGFEIVDDQQRAGVMGSVQTRWTYERARSEANRVHATLPFVPGYRIQFLVSRND